MILSKYTMHDFIHVVYVNHSTSTYHINVDVQVVYLKYVYIIVSISQTPKVH